MPKTGYYLGLLSCAAVGAAQYAPIMRSNRQGCFYFGEGWVSFARQINAKLGCVLLFKYVGLLDFKVTVFDVATINAHGSITYEECAHAKGVPPVPELYPYAEAVDLKVLEAEAFIRKMSPTTKGPIVIPNQFQIQTVIQKQRVVMMHAFNKRLCWPELIVKINSKSYKFGNEWADVYESLGCEEGDSCRFSVNAMLSRKECLFITVEKVITEVLVKKNRATFVCLPTPGAEWERALMQV